MPKYLIQANYVGDGVEGLLNDGGSKRRAVVEKAFRSMGGTIEAFYFAFGATDLYVIGDFPDHASITALALTVAATGRATTKTTVLMTTEEVDEAVKKSPAYTAPGA